jgi:hypothetical protein
VHQTRAPDEGETLYLGGGGSIIDTGAPSLRGPLPRRPEDLPRGLIIPPEQVRERVAAEKQRLALQQVAPEAEERLLNDWTVAYYFDYLGHEVIYRQTPAGPEVLAVGAQEVIALKQTLPLEEQLRLQTWLPY